MKNTMQVNLIGHTDAFYAKEQFGDWWESHNHKIASVYKGEGYGEPVDFEPKIGNYYYVVSIKYTTGDSFGQSTGCMEVLWIYEEEHLAKQLQKLIKAEVSVARDTIHYR